MIQPAQLDLTIYQRATYRLQIRLNADDVPLDATGYEAAAQIWDQFRNRKYAEFDVQWIDRSEGLLEIVLQYDETAEIEEQAYWDLLVVEPSGDRYFWLEGKVFFDPGYTELEEP